MRGALGREYARVEGAGRRGHRGEGALGEGVQRGGGGG